MRSTSAVGIAVVFLLGLQQVCCGCGKPPKPPEIPCIGFFGNSLVLQLGTVFQTNATSQCSAGIGLLGAPPLLNFSIAGIGVQNTLTNAFTPLFNLNRFPGADSAWANGTDMNGTQALAGATWFGFSNLAVPPVTPPPLGLNDIFAIKFDMVGLFNLQGLQVQFGSGAGTSSGLPDFIHFPDPTHSATYALPVNVPQLGTATWVPEPPSYIAYLVLALMVGVGGIGAKRAKRLRLDRGPAVPV